MMLQKKTKEHKPNWSQILHHSHRILMIWGSRLGKTNELLNLINHKLYANKIYLYEAKYQSLIKKRNDAD